MTDTVRIGDREFRVGAWYLPANPKSRIASRKLHAYLLGVVWWADKADRRFWISRRQWLRWAGDEVTP